MSAHRGPILAGTLAVALAVPTVAALAFPPEASAQEPERSRPAALEGSSLTWCGDVEPIRADPALYRDAPVYIGNPPTDELRRWARRQPGFAGIWIDRENLGWITVLFTEGAAARQRQLERRFPDLGAVAVGVEHSARELQQLQQRVGQVVFPRVGEAASALDTPANVVDLFVGELDEAAVELIESEFADEPLCVDGRDPSELVPDGAQPLAGDGWQLVGYLQGPGSPVYRTGIATDQAQLEALWLEAGMPDQPPAVDVEASVVLWFAQPHGSSCRNLRLDDVIVEQERALVYPLIVMPDDPVFCTDDIAGAYQFLVALERSRLPDGPFAIQLDADDPPPGAPEERTIVEADLRAPGSTVDTSEVHADPSVGEPRALRSGAVVEPGNPARYQFDVRCGIGYLGQINGVHWVTDATDLPGAWVPLVGEDSQLVVDVRLREEPEPRAMVEAGGQRVRYEPVRDAPPTCEG